MLKTLVCIKLVVVIIVLAALAVTRGHRIKGYVLGSLAGGLTVIAMVCVWGLFIL